MKKKLVVTATAILAVFAALLAMVRFGVFVYPYAISKLTEVPVYDLLEAQYARELEILDEYAQDAYTLEEPYILLDPYGFNPLAALVMFEAPKAYEVEITVPGSDAYDTFTYTHSVEAPRAEVPIIGLYPGRENAVTLTVDGRSCTYAIVTEPLPVTMQQYTLVSSQPEKMAQGITLFIAFFEHSNAALVDCYGQVRGYIASPGMAQRTPLLLLKNGSILAGGDEYKMTPYNMASLLEYNWLGKVFREYEVPHAAHHGVCELPGGDLLITANNRDMFETGTREDVAVILGRESGTVIKEYDFRKIVDETRSPFHHFNPDILNAPSRDWMHMNAAIYDEANNAVVVSSPTQSMVISVDADSAAINWILGPHEGYNDELKQYLLTPVGDDFEWQWCQHDPSILSGQDGSPDTVDILLFNNGQSGSFTEEGSIHAQENASRVMHYRINQREMTAELLWQYGRDRDDYSTFLGSAEDHGETVLISFGGQLRVDDKPVDTIISGVFGGTATRSRVVEVTREGEVVFEVSVHEAPGASSAETYQARRMPLYVPESFRYRLGELKAERLGESYKVAQTDEQSPPNLYINALSAEFHDLHREGGRLIVDGTLLYKGERRIIGKAYLIFRGKRGAYVYAANSSINGRFMASVDLTELPPGEYEITVAGGLMEGNDALNGKALRGHFKTGYKVTVSADTA